MNKALKLLTIATVVLSTGILHAQEGVFLKGEGQGAFALAMEIKDSDRIPENVVMVNPVGFDKTACNSVYPAAMPPYNPEGSNLVMVLEETVQNKDREAALQYMKTWKGWGGNVAVVGSRDSVEVVLYGMMTEKKAEAPNPAAIPARGWAKARHEAKAKMISENAYKVIFIGNSITHNMERADYVPVWNKYFGDRMALNLGTSGYRTENLLWELDNFDLGRQKPELCIIGIGTNNVDEKNYPYRCTSEELAGGIKAILDRVRTAWPESKVILLRCFPGSYDGQLPTSHRMILDKASDIVSTFADNENIFFCDVNHNFLNEDGSLREDMFYDWLHPSVKGAEAWFSEMESLVCRILGDKDHREVSE